jgi:hypothetical protein
MDLTVNQYLINPMGKGSATSSLRIIKEEYDARYDAMISVHDDFDMAIYNIKDVYYIHLVIPSETKKAINYDFVFKFDYSKNSKDTSLFNLPIKVICNCPSFVFTYAYVYRREKLLIDELTDLVPTESVKEAPTVRNPYKVLGIEKTMYYACKYIKHNVTGKLFLEENSSLFNLKNLKSQIPTFDQIMKAIDLYENDKTRENKKLKQQKQKDMNKMLHDREHVIEPAKKVSSSKKRDGVTKARTVKRAKRI